MKWKITTKLVRDRAEQKLGSIRICHGLKDNRFLLWNSNAPGIPYGAATLKEAKQLAKELDMMDDRRKAKYRWRYLKC